MTLLSLQKLCATNSRSAKEQKNTHTTGRKSHARLKKEMVKNNHPMLFVIFTIISSWVLKWSSNYNLVQEDKKKRKVHRLELWEAAHKKKNGRYTTDKVETLVVHFLLLIIYVSSAIQFSDIWPSNIFSSIGCIFWGITKKEREQQWWSFSSRF